MNIPSLIASFATGTYTVKRRAAATVDRHGIKVPGTVTTFTVIASASPVKGLDLLELPELRRTEETRAFFTATQLLVGDQGGAYEADLVTIEGEDWEVQSAAKWLYWDGVDVGYRCLVQRP